MQYKFKISFKTLFAIIYLLISKFKPLKFENLKRMFILHCNSEHEIDSDTDLD